ncbi:MAG: T9SS type A sorting domain-containing protein, partial [Bacteroidota bacterium]
ASITITEPAADLSASISGTNVDCFGNATGAADLSVSGGTAPYTYSWSNTAVSQDLSNIVAGTYSVTVTDANGCTTSASVTITEPAAALAASVAGTNILCNGASTGAADVTVSGGTSPYTYSWSNGSTDEDLSSITAGTYTVTATDANGCTVSASVTLTEPSALVASNVKGVIACGDTTAVITVSATGGVAPYTGTGSFTITAGAYSYTVTDANGCTSTTSDSLFNYPVINVDLNVAYPTIQSAVDAAVAGNTIQICAGNYTENVTVNKSLTLDGAGASTVITSSTAATPVITVTGSGANASSRMVIRDMKLVGATGDENTGSGILYAASAAAGYYTIENVEASGNAGSGVSFNNTASVTDVVISNSNFSSNGNGLRISSGVPSFDGLAMSGTQMNNNSWSAIRYNPLSNLSMVGSNFSITNCSFSDNSQAGISNLHDISFNGFKGNVSLSNVTVVSSNGPSSTHKSSAISFGHGSTAAPSGNISLSNVTVSGTVGRHAVAFSSYNDVNNISMSGVSLQNCVAPLGSVGASHTDTDPLNLGNTSLVSVTMQSTGGATATSATFHNASTLAALSASVIADCFTIEDQVTGAIDASGLGMVRFKANQAFVTPNSFSSPTTTAPSIQRAVDASASGDVIYVAAGTYNNKVTVTKSLAFNGAKFGQDARSRSTASGESIIDGTSLTGDAFKINNNVSNVVIDGFEIRNFAGSGATGDGNAVSSFTTSTSLIGSNNSTVRNNYIHDMGYNGVYVGSDNATATIMVRQSGWLVRYNKFANCNNTAVELTNVASSQVRDNDIAAPATLFSATGDAGNGIEIGARSFTKSSTTTTIDVTGNTFSGSYPAGGRAAISVLSRANQSASNATVSGLTISGNTINGASNARAAVLLVSETRNTGPATLVNVTVTGNVMDGNSNGVVIQDFKNGGTNATHSSLSITNNDIRNSVSNGVHVLANTSALGITVGSNKLTGNGGHALRNDGTDVLSATCNWYGSTASGVVTASISGSATFSPWIVNGTDFDLVTLGFQPVPGSCTGTLVNTTITSQVNVLCFGNSTGSINLTVSGGKPPYLYNWSNGVTIQDPSGLAAGTYTVTVTDANGSTSTISATITQPAAALSASTSGTNVLCFGNATGAADLSVSGGTTPYSYSWSTGATTEDLSGIVSGSYNVTVTDANGCTTSSGVTITQPAAALGGSVSGTNVDCNGNATGAADLSVTGGTAPYSYSWNNGAITQDLSGLVAGTYTVVITDANGCSATRSITITEPATLVASSSNTSVTCLGATSTITVSAVGGTAPYSGTGDYTVVAGTYSYTVTDANGCTSTTNITVSEADVVFPTITVPADITVGTDAGVCYATVASLGTPVTSDNCAVVSVTNNAPATYPVGTTTVTWTVVDPAGNTTTANQLVTVTNTLPALGAVQGTLTACVPYAAGSTTFSVAPISDGINSTVYNWTVPTGFTISAGQGTSSITVTWTSITLDPTIAGQISVIASTPCSTRTSNASVVYASTAPVTPPSISGPSRVCPGETVTYSVASVARASSYVWTVATGMTITAGAGTNVITVSVDGSYTGGNVTVAASNSCGTSPVRTRTTVFNTPNTPGAISGTTSGVCGLTQTYSIVAVSGASSYTWSVSGGTINSGQGTNSVSVSWTGSGTTGSIAVKSVNACGESALRTASINKIPARPEPIVGSTTPCGGTTQAYSVATVASASSYTWTVTAGGAISAGQGTKNITVDWTAGVTIGQTLAVRASNACGNSTNRTIAVSIQSCPREAMEAGSILSMTAYPNPATDFVNVYFTTANIAEYTIQLMDMSGRVLRNFDGESTEGVNNVPFEMSDLSSGMYLIVLDHDSSRQTIRLVVE